MITPPGTPGVTKAVMLFGWREEEGRRGEETSEANERKRSIIIDPLDETACRSYI